MKACIHQPNYLPYLGIINKIKNSDVYIIYNTAQYVKDRFDNRNKIKTPQGELWLTIPLKDRDSFKKRFFEVKLPKDSKWQKKHWRAIEVNYSKANYFSSYAEEVKKIYDGKYEMLSEISEKIIFFLLKEFKVGTKVVKATELDLNLELKQTESIIEMLKKVGAKEYLSGSSGKKYMDEKLLEKEGIRVEYQHFEHPEYKQLYGKFIKDLAAIDLLFNEGEKAERFI